LIFTDHLPGSVKFALVVHVAVLWIAVTSLSHAVNVLLSKTIDTGTVVGSECNLAHLLLAWGSSFFLFAGCPEVVEVLAIPRLMKLEFALWLVNSVIQGEPGVVLVPELLGSSKLSHLVAILLLINPFAVVDIGIIKSTVDIIIFIGAALLVHNVVDSSGAAHRSAG
jgi:hypothetical protein